jgi:hypothetical protein
MMPNEAMDALAPPITHLTPRSTIPRSCPPWFLDVYGLMTRNRFVHASAAAFFLTEPQGSRLRQSRRAWPSPLRQGPQVADLAVFATIYL